MYNFGIDVVTFSRPRGFVNTAVVAAAALQVHT